MHFVRHAFSNHVEVLNKVALIDLLAQSVTSLGDSILPLQFYEIIFQHLQFISIIISTISYVEV